MHKKIYVVCLQSRDLQLDIISASAPGAEVKLRDANHELNEEKRRSARRKEYVCFNTHIHTKNPMSPEIDTLPYPLKRALGRGYV